MRLKIFVIAATAVILSNAYGANQKHPDPVEDVLEKCSYESQAGMRDCLTKNVSESSRVLISAEKKLVLALKQWNEQPKFVSKASDQLISSNDAYLKYRDAQCAFASALGGGAIGNALELRRLACIFGLNMERAEHLIHLASSLPRK